ncbi:hypothetical protein GGR58DRAFT_522395 [Xylaria digitata]|nr:hypothetical protein GGR58DRAFT_522395 [Xylaria digitata]
MQSLSRLVVLSLVLFLGIVTGIPSPVQHRRELRPRLSKGSTIFGPESPNFGNATQRFSLLSPPEIQVVVIPARESDVSEIVKYCVENGIEFLAYNRGHGSTTSLGKFKGLEIDMQYLNGITIAADKKSAVLQGGTYNDQVMRALWKEGYVATTGSTDCPGVLGPGLGGGHGRLEGLYGLVSDNFLRLNVVLSDGSAIEINATSHPDLFWALQGASHNFALVTSVKMKIYPCEVDTWHYHSYWWTGDKLEQVFAAINKFHKSDNNTTLPRMGVNAGAVLMNSISRTKASLFWSFTSAGSAAEAEKLLEPFGAIENVGEESGDMIDASHGGCASATYATSSILMKDYNDWAGRYPELESVSCYFYEGYATKAVQAVDQASTAYPHRDEIHLVYFSTAVPDDSGLLDSALDWAKATWDIWVAGSDPVEPKIYVNYAKGHDYETKEAVYGYEPWRLARLRRLKAKYDPHNRFRYYVPII